jgi:hypothetical protein
VLRTAALAAGAKVLEGLLEKVGVGRPQQPVQCECKNTMQSRGTRNKQLLTTLGPIAFTRSLYQCGKCGKTRYPGDEALGICGTSRSPGVRRLEAHFGAKQPFKEAASDIALAAGLKTSPKDVERVAESTGRDVAQWEAAQREAARRMEPPPLEAPKDINVLYIAYDGTGVPMVPGELAGRKGKQEDGSAKTREAKLGCVFTQTTLDDKGRPIRDPGSTTYTGAIETAAVFGKRIYGEAVRRGLHRARQVVVLSDGAEWAKNLAQEQFGTAVHILDLYHAREHVSQLCLALFDRDIKRLNRYRDRWWEWLDEGNIEAISQEVQALLPKNPNSRKEARRELAYLEKNKEHMRYAQFRRRGYFVGSGVIEAGCKTIVAKRMKQSGMEWSLAGANAIIELRCNLLSRRQEDYWEDSAA